MTTSERNLKPNCEKEHYEIHIAARGRSVSGGPDSRSLEEQRRIWYIAVCHTGAIHVTMAVLEMANNKIGIWFIGAWGGVSTTAAVGLAAMQSGAARETALVSGLPCFANLGLADWRQFVVGGHEIRQTDYAEQTEALHTHSRVFDRDLLSAAGPMLAAFDRNIRTGTLKNVGETIASLAAPEAQQTTDEPLAAAIERISADLVEFRESHGLDHAIVVNLASTEPLLENDAAGMSWPELRKAIDHADQLPIPASSIYAIAAMLTGCSYVNFTPSVGSNMPPLYELARERGVLHAGRDGKTGETLIKSVLAPMFAARNLNVMSWVGHNIFGNMDGKVLDDPVNKANKVRSKDHLLTEILGYKPQTLVSIEYIESMADWKTAWDHIHFQGFLDSQMTLQFIWQGCDSLLAAPLVLDLVRFTEREWRRGKCGVMSHLASFFKSPMGTSEPQFQKQFDMLQQWADDVAAGR